VGIARAVLQNPKLLLVDEPTSSLDPESSRKVMELLTEIAQEDDIPVLINIHEVHLAEEFADRILGLSDGELVFEGRVAELTDDVKDLIYRDGEEINAEDSPTESPKRAEPPANQTEIESNTEL
jgi:phosphonate transport system ATP-binding protein